MGTPVLSYTCAAGEKGQRGRTAVVVASGCQVSPHGLPGAPLPPPPLSPLRQHPRSVTTHEATGLKPAADPAEM